MNRPLISIVVASYNYANYLPLTLDSLLSQTYSNLQVVVVDDGSADNSLEVARRYAALDERVILLTHPGGANRGLVETLRLGIDHCKGQYIAFCESDDMWTHNHLEIIVEALKRHPEARIVSNGVITFGNPEKVGWLKKYFRRLERRLTDGMNVVDVRRRLTYNWIPTFSCVMFEAGALRSLDFDSPVRKWADLWLYQQLLCRQPLLHVKHPLTLWRMHGGSQNSNHRDPNTDLFRRRLAEMMDGLTGGARHDLYFRDRPLKYLWYKLRGKV